MPDVCLCSHGAIAIFSDSVVVDVVCDSDVLVMVVAELSVDVVVVILVLPLLPEVDVLEVLDDVLYDEEVCC